MKRAVLLLLLFLALTAAAAFAQETGEALEQGLEQALKDVDIQALEAVSGQTGLREVLLRLARGELVWDAQTVLALLRELALGELRRSFLRMTGLLAPALLCGIAGTLRPRGAGIMAQNACFLTLAAFMAADLKIYLAEANSTVARMSELMQTLFPMLITLLAAVGATGGAALFKPAVAAASGTMTALVRGVSLNLAMGVAVVTLLDHLSEKHMLSRLAELMRRVSAWTLGIAFTVFIGVTAMQGLTAAAADGVSIRAAKYAVDHFVPVVGGMFADTMDTLVGCSLLVKNALGITGLALLLSTAGLPLLRTLCASAVYRLCAALLQPVAPERVGGMLQSFSDVLLLLFVILLSVGAMFLLLTAQMLAVGNVTVGLR